MNIHSDHEIDNFFLEGITLSIKELNITVSKQNLNISLDIMDNGKWIHVSGRDATIYIDEVKDAFSKKVSKLGLYGKFRKVKTATVVLEFKYTIDGEEKNTTVIREYNVKRKTSIAFLDFITSV
jgi:hypothetical protein